jgi:hypothetical protein
MVRPRIGRYAGLGRHGRIIAKSGRRRRDHASPPPRAAAFAAAAFVRAAAARRPLSRSPCRRNGGGARTRAPLSGSSGPAPIDLGANPTPSRPAPQVLACDIDLLHPPAELEKRKHKLHRLVASPNSYFMDVKCQGCFTMWVPPPRAARCPITSRGAPLRASCAPPSPPPPSPHPPCAAPRCSRTPRRWSSALAATRSSASPPAARRASPRAARSGGRATRPRARRARRGRSPKKSPSRQASSV